MSPKIRSISRSDASLTLDMDESPEREEIVRRVIEAATCDDPHTMVTTLFEEGVKSRVVRFQIAADHTDVFKGGPIHRARQQAAMNAAYTVLTDAVSARRREGPP